MSSEFILVKAEVPAHAQRMSSLLASDKEGVSCRVERRAYKAGYRCGLGGGMGPTAGSRGARARAERTKNMCRMSVTLDVSKLSGWLNATAPYRVERRAYDAGRGAGRGEA